MTCFTKIIWAQNFGIQKGEEMLMLHCLSCIILQITQKHTHTFNNRGWVENDPVRSCSIETGDETTSIVKQLDYMAMDQYLYIPFLGGWTSIYQLFWCELQGYYWFWHTAISHGRFLKLPNFPGFWLGQFAGEKTVDFPFKISPGRTTETPRAAGNHRWLLPESKGQRNPPYLMDFDGKKQVKTMVSSIYTVDFPLNPSID